MIPKVDIDKLEFDDTETDIQTEDVEYPVIAVVGRRGSGKTLFMTSYAVDAYFESLERVKAYQRGEYKLKRGESAPTPLKIFSNYPLYKIPYTYITYAEVQELPDYLMDGLVLFDEILIGADAYKPFSKSNESIYLFVSQMRKRRCTLLYTAQMFTQAAKRLRLQTNYIYQITKFGVRGHINLQVYNWGDDQPMNMIKDIDLNLRAYFKYYDTNYVVRFDE